MSNRSQQGVLQIWFVRGMLTGNAKAMIGRCVDIIKGKGEMISSEDIKVWSFGNQELAKLTW